MSKKVKKSLRDRLELAQVEAEFTGLTGTEPLVWAPLRPAGEKRIAPERDAFAVLLSNWWLAARPRRRFIPQPAENEKGK